VTAGPADPQTLRIDLDSEQVGRGLSHLVVVVLEVLSELLERQAVRRMDVGDLDASQIEALGLGVMNGRRQIDQLRAAVLAAEQPAARTTKQNPDPEGRMNEKDES